MNSIFADPGWIAFVEQKHQLNHRFLTAGTLGDDTAFAQILVFVNSRGKIRTPRLMPYMPIYLQTTQTTSLTKIQRQWLTLGGELASQMRELGFGGALSLDPEVKDARPWQWQGMTAEVRYTYRFDLPKDLASTSSAVRRNIKKAQRSGYTVQRTTNSSAVVQCLNESEKRQGFGYGLEVEDIDFLLGNMAENAIRMYEVRDANGALAAARIVLAPEGGIAIDLVSGTFQSHLNSGATQLAIAHSLEELHQSGVTSFDFEGANIDSVASSKMEWGAELVPFYTLSQMGPRSMALQGKRWITKVIREAKK